MSRRSFKRRLTKRLLPIIFVIIIGIFSYFTQPWEYFGGIPVVTEAPDDLQVHFINAGQGDCILLRVPSIDDADGDGVENILIDAGTSQTWDADDTLDYLSSYGITSLDYLILTHPHSDHIGAADEVIENYEIANLILPECDPLLWGDVLDVMDEKNLEYISAEPGNTYYAGDAILTILAPVDISSLDDVNDYSVVVRLDYGESSFLFTGDATEESEEQMLGAYQDELDCDVLKVGHHGSSTSTTLDFLLDVSPDIAVISVGDPDMDSNTQRYGHPSAIIITRLDEYVPALILTRDDGTIILVSDKVSISRLTSD